MATRTLLAASFIALFFFAACHTPSEREAEPAPSVGEGAFPEPWICGLACDEDPPIQVQRFGEGLVVLRESKCIHFEAPFLYLLLGSERALLLDTGAPGEFGVAETVLGLVAEWRREHDLPEDYELVVAHTHAHFDHIMGDPQFLDRENVRVIGYSVDNVCEFFGLESWPNEISTIDLGGRVLDIIPTPGHHPAHITVYDRNNEILITGDTLYPGFLFVFSPTHWKDFRASTARMLEFARQNPVRWIFGCHVEMSRNPGESYPYGTQKHPEERVLELEVRHLEELHASLEAMGDDIAPKVHDDFVIYPVWAAKRK